MCDAFIVRAWSWSFNSQSFLKMCDIKSTEVWSGLPKAASPRSRGAVYPLCPLRTSELWLQGSGVVLPASIYS